MKSNSQTIRFKSQEGNLLDMYLYILDGNTLAWRNFVSGALNLPGLHLRIARAD